MILNSITLSSTGLAFSSKKAKAQYRSISVHGANASCYFNIPYFVNIFRNFLKSKWGMEAFMIADAEAVNGRKNFIIIILKDKLNKAE